MELQWTHECGMPLTNSEVDVDHRVALHDSHNRLHGRDGFHGSDSWRAIPLGAVESICVSLQDLTFLQVSEFAPATFEQPLSYIVGWMAFLAWVSAVPACAQVMTQMVQGMALIRNPDANIIELWQATLLIFLFMIMIFSFNIFLPKYLPLAESIMVCQSLVQDFVVSMQFAVADTCSLWSTSSASSSF